MLYRSFKDYIASAAMQCAYHGEPGGQVKNYMSENPQWIGPEHSVLTLADLLINGDILKAV